MLGRGRRYVCAPCDTYPTLPGVAEACSFVNGHGVYTLLADTL